MLRKFLFVMVLVASSVSMVACGPPLTPEEQKCEDTCELAKRTCIRYGKLSRSDESWEKWNLACRQTAIACISDCHDAMDAKWAKLEE